MKMIMIILTAMVHDDYCDNDHQDDDDQHDDGDQRDDDDDGSPAYSHQSKSHHVGVLTVMITVGDSSLADSHH